MRDFTWVGLISCPNTELGCKGLLRTNALAYLPGSSETKEKELNSIDTGSLNTSLEISLKLDDPAKKIFFVQFRE